MRIKIFCLFIIITFAAHVNPLFAWGNKAHRLVNGKAIEMLPSEMSFVKALKEYIEDKASDADIRRDNKTDTTEWPKHYIDIDFYQEFIEGKMIFDKNELMSLYGNETVTKMGLLPWAALDSYNKLVQSFRDKNRDNIIIFSADLGHYIGDGHQPFHTCLNYDGQLTGQKGIHGRYESEMVNRYIDQIANSIATQEINYVDNPLEYIFDFLTASNFYSPVIFNADRTAYAQTGSHGSADYYRLLWFRTKHVTINQLSDAAAVLSSLIYSAWMDADKPILGELN